ncbi:glycosyltransferase family 2 protein [Campylobacter volucris]|uniref:Glycosyltransferase family 2 protein n=1 Tax=Campylobacter volucris TaxID=1031542 RepID=A0A5C7DUY7_9BACT|nr:glycosyltransferase family 2 protein [Campylobacter volucris]TXE88606.1 glycosyltransferase family 2 protein [Campylobacter volucris]
MKSVGVVIPIYNVQKYLKECLDSVINQTYKNLQVILVNDGSTDENSLKIAKEYTLKDERFILFDKENGGLSSARNVGIEYFSGEYKLKNITTPIKENSLIEFELDGNNPYNIHKVYKSYKAFNNEQDLINFTYPIIDYIIFLDSDDYWELNCIEECVPRMDGVEIVWFDETNYYELPYNKKKQNNRFKDINIKKEKKITSCEWAKYILNSKMKDFSFAWNGMISFPYIFKKQIKFENKLFAEDHLFGILLFSQSSNIYILPNSLYFYRIRVNSLTNQYDKITEENIIPHLKQVYNSFNKNPILTMEYFKISSWVQICLKLINFFNANRDNKIICILQKSILYFYINNALKIKNFDKDPLNMKQKLIFIEPYKTTKIKYKFYRYILKIKIKMAKYLKI